MVAGTGRGDPPRDAQAAPSHPHPARDGRLRPRRRPRVAATARSRGQRTGDGQVLLVEGEAGIGKTRLVDEFVGRPRARGRGPELPLRRVSAGRGGDGLGRVVDGLPRALRDAGLGVRTSTGHAGPRAGLRRAAPGRAAAGGTRRRSRRSRCRPSSCGRRRPSPPSVRPIVLDRGPPPRARGGARALRVARPGGAGAPRAPDRDVAARSSPRRGSASLTRLEQVEHRTLAAARPEGPVAPARGRLPLASGWPRSWACKIARKSDGNPFFAFEIVRGLKEGQFLTQKPGRVVGEHGRHRRVRRSRRRCWIWCNARVADLDRGGPRPARRRRRACGFEFDPVARGGGRGLSPDLRP